MPPQIPQYMEHSAFPHADYFPARLRSVTESSVCPSEHIMHRHLSVHKIYGHPMKANPHQAIEHLSAKTPRLALHRCETEHHADDKLQQSRGSDSLCRSRYLHTSRRPARFYHPSHVPWFAVAPFHV